MSEKIYWNEEQKGAICDKPHCCTLMDQSLRSYENMIHFDKQSMCIIGIVNPVEDWCNIFAWCPFCRKKLVNG